MYRFVLLPLSKQTISILHKLYPFSGHREIVFPGGHSPLRPMTEAVINAALKRRDSDTQAEITGHGFRAMARPIPHEQINIDPPYN